MPAKKPAPKKRGRKPGPEKVFFATKILTATDTEIRRLHKAQKLPSIGAVLDAAFTPKPKKQH